METFDFDEYVRKQLENPEYKKAYDKFHERIEYINTNVKGVNRQYLIAQISLYKIDAKYLNTLSTKKLYNIAKQYNIVWDKERK